MEHDLTPADLDSSPEGCLVQAADGRVFFIPTHDQHRLLASPTHRAVYEKLFTTGGKHSGPVIQPEFSCEALWNWMMNHNPNTMSWRKVSVIWMNQC